MESHPKGISLTSNNPKLPIVMRTLAAIFAGYALANLFSIFLARALPFAFAISSGEAFIIGSLLSFGLWVGAAMWAFAAKSAARAWGGLVGPIGLLVVAIWLLQA